jgi:hemolysin III
MLNQKNAESKKIAIHMTQLSSETVNYFSHGLAGLSWIPLSLLLLFRAGSRIDLFLVSLVYGISACCMFFASALYHKYKLSENERTLRRKLDHIAIFIMIAGTYTPIVWIWFDEPWRTGILCLQWLLTLAGAAYQLLAKQKKRIVETLLYLAMGWVVVFSLPVLLGRMGLHLFLDLCLGGLAYSVGAIIYAIKKPVLFPGKFGFHELFHLFIILGAVFHWILIFRSLGR